VIGANSIAAYLLAHLHGAFIVGTLRTHFGPGMFSAFGPEYDPLIKGAATLLVFWLTLAWMYQRRIYLRI
jgi:predicted acyltransferase